MLNSTNQINIGHLTTGLRTGVYCGRFVLSLRPSQQRNNAQNVTNHAIFRRKFEFFEHTAQFQYRRRNFSQALFQAAPQSSNCCLTPLEEKDFSSLTLCFHAAGWLAGAWSAFVVSLHQETKPMQFLYKLIVCHLVGQRL